MEKGTHQEYEMSNEQKPPVGAKPSDPQPGSGTTPTKPRKSEAMDDTPGAEEEEEE